MPEYDFKPLSPYDFQAFVRDLLNADRGWRLETFARGRDGGIDLRQVGPNGALVVQCKHYVRSGWPKLEAAVRSEAGKVKELNPARYVLATSVDLTAHNKDSVTEMLAPHLISPEDVVGQGDLNTALGRHPEVETAHFKLWLTSVSVLQHVLNAALLTHADHVLQDLQRRLETYVPNGSYTRAADILRESHVCVIAGIPGIGKSLLAQALLASYVRDGFQPVIVSRDIADANTFYHSQARQVFYYDDFLGQALGTEKEFNKNEDSRLLEFVRRVSNDDTKRFILTTREYILADARRRFDKLSATERFLGKCIIGMRDYGELERAQILFNHLYHSTLPQAVLRDFAVSRLYRAVIRHSNYNPRLIEQMVDMAGGTPTSAGSLQAAFLSVLHDPRRVWQTAFESHLTELARTALWALLLLPAGVSLRDLEAATLRLHGARGGVGGNSDAFHGAVAILEGTFLSFQRVGGDTAVDFHNPSIRDFLLGRLEERPSALAELLNGVAFFEQAASLWGFATAHDASQLRFPCIRRWCEESTEHVVSTLLRAVSAHPPRVPVDGGERRQGSPDRVPLESRLARVLGACDDLAIRNGTERIALHLEEAAARWRAGTADWDGSIELLYLPGLPQDSRDCCSEWVLQTVETVDQFRDLTYLLDEYPECFSKEHMQHLHDRFDLFMENEIDYILHQATLPSEVSSSYEELEHLAGELGQVLTGISEERVSERIDELRETRGERSEYSTESRRVRDAQARSEAEIESRVDSMFSLLAE